MTEETATVDYIADAKTGDRVWMLDIQRNVYDENGNYLGRGKWSLVTVDKETRQSFIAYHGTKFDRTNGIQRATGGYAASFQITGQKEYEGLAWANKHSYKIKQAIDRINDIDMLKQIAAIIGYDDLK